MPQVRAIPAQLLWKICLHTSTQSIFHNVMSPSAHPQARVEPSGDSATLRIASPS